VILFDRDGLTGTAGRNITAPEQLVALTSALRTAALGGPTGPELLIAVDQEGGRVARLNPSNGYPATESQADLGAVDDLDHTTDVATLTAITLVGAGIDVNLAPVVDVNLNPTNPAIGALDRSFSADGRSSRPRLPAGVMVGHIRNDQLDPERPASLSVPTVTGLLRGDLGWDGLVVSDDLQASAITQAYGADEAIALAIEAGIDLLLFANQQVYDAQIVEHAIATIVELVNSGRITESRLDESVARIEALFGTVE
jgi:beta-N-acetylhexosaminidase